MFLDNKPYNQKPVILDYYRKINEKFPIVITSEQKIQFNSKNRKEIQELIDDLVLFGFFYYLILGTRHYKTILKQLGKQTKIERKHGKIKTTIQTSISYDDIMKRAIDIAHEFQSLFGESFQFNTVDELENIVNERTKDFHKLITKTIKKNKGLSTKLRGINDKINEQNSYRPENFDLTLLGK